MLKRKKPRVMKKRRLMNVGAFRRRVKRSLSAFKLYRRGRSYFVQQESTDTATVSPAPSA
ncbi:MAG TPA: hypothetical protein DCS87_10000 [Rheinheimera sp.]|nr:hypothetical protein [Rheinheimera sp.]